MLTARTTAIFYCIILCMMAGGPQANPTQISDYDTHLCETAQRLIINAGSDLRVIEQRASGNGFHTIQMNVDTAKNAAVIAMTTEYTETGGAQQSTYIACKMVNRERVNDMLGLQLPGPDRQCRAVNEATYELALAQLKPAELERYLGLGRQLKFADDAIIATGGEWLPIKLDDFILIDNDNNVTARSPSVRVPWNPEEKNFYQGTQHCKLISLAAMNRWVREAAFDSAATLIPSSADDCTAPHSMTSSTGSCLFYFAPAGAMFCQDYSGSEWTGATAKQECGARHASAAALKAARNRYEGTGGIFSESACATRKDAPDISGTCVFHCKAGDETLWHIGGAIDSRMTRGCDLFIGAD